MFSQFFCEVRSFEAEFKISLQKIEFVADIVAFSLKAEAVHSLPGEHGAHRISELNLVVFPAGRKRLELSWKWRTLEGGEDEERLS